MANKKLMATAQLFLNTKDAKKDAKIFIDDLKQKLTDIETAADKMTVFKDMVQYIAQIDKALAALKANNKDTFNSMFDGLDANLKKQLEGIFGMDGVKLGQLDVLRDTLDNLTTKASIKEIREFAKALNEIYEGIGHKAPFEDIENEFKEFSKEAKAKHIETLSNQLANFATVWKNVNSQISKGFGVGGSGFGGVSGLSKEVQDEIDKLKKQEEEIKDIINTINNPKKVKVTLMQQSDNQVEQLKTLKDAFVSAADAKKQFETNKMTGTPEYLNSVAKYVQAAAELKSAFESTKLTKAGNEWIMSSGLGVLQDADNVLDKFFVQNKDLMDKVVNMYKNNIHNIGAQISFLEKPYDTLKSTMEEYADLQNQMNHEERFSQDEIDDIDTRIQELEKYLFTLDKVGDKKNDIQKILSSVTFDGMGGLAAAEEFCKLLGVEIPQAAQKAEDALKTVAAGNTGIVTTDVANSANNIVEDVKETVSAIDYAKKELTKAWQEYYRAVQQAANDYDLLIEDGETSPEMDKIKAAIDKKIDSWGVTATNPSKWGVKVDLDLADAIADGDIDASGIEREIDKLIKQHGISFNIPIEEMAGDSNKSLDAMNGNIQQTVDALSNAEYELVDTKTAFQNLVNYISQSGDKPSKFFDKLESGAQSVDDELKSILQSLNLIDMSGNVNLSSIKSGFTNKGGFVSDNYTMIARHITGQYGQDYLGKSEKLQTQLASAQQAGAQIGAIFALIKDEAHGLFYEIQNTVPGEAAFSHHKMDVNADVLNASKEQLSDLVHTMKALSDNGLFIDFGGDNILYDKDKGFSIIDLGLVGDQYHTVSGQNTLQENIDRFIKEYFKFAPSSMHADIQTMFADTLYDVAQSVDANIVNPNGPSKQQIDSNKRIIAATKAEESAHKQNAEAIDAEKAALEALIQLKAKAQNMKWKDFAKDESLTGLKDAAGFTSISQLEKFWKQARYDKQIDFHEISDSEAHKIFNSKLTPGLASQWYGPQKFPVKDQLENEILQDDEVRNAALSFMYHLYKNWLPGTYKNPNVNSFEDFLNTEFTVYRGDDAPLVYGDESKMSFSFNKEKAENFNSSIGTVKVKPKDTIGNAGSGIESEVEIFGMKSSDTSWFKETNETFEDFYNKQTKEMQDEINAGLVNLEKRRIQDLLDENVSKLAHKAGKDTDFKNGALKQFQQGTVPDSLDVVGDGTIADQFAAAYNGLSDIDKKLVAYYANLEAISKTLPDQFSISQYGTESSKKMVGEDAKLFNAVLNDPTGVQKYVAQLTGESKFGILGQNAQDINLEANMHKMNAQAIEEEAKAQQELNQKKSLAGRMFNDVSTKLHKDAENKDGSVVRDLSEIWDGAKSISKTIDGPYADQDIIDIGGYINHITGEVQKVKDLIDKVNDVMANTGIDLSYVQDYISEMYKGADLDEIDKELNSVMGVASNSDYDAVSDNLKRLVNSKQAGSEEFNMLAHVWHQLKHVDWTTQNGALDDDINNGKYYSSFNGEFQNVSDLYAFIDEIKDKWGTNLIEVKEYLNKVFARYNQNQQEGYKLDEDLILDLDDFDLDDIDDQPVDNIAAYNNAFSQALSEYASATGKKEEKLNKLIEYLKEVQVTEQESIDDGEIQIGVEGEIAKIEDVYALVDEIQNKHSTDLSDVKYYLDQVFETYNKKSSTAQTELSSIGSTDKIDYWDVKDKLFDEVFAGHDEDVGEKLKTLLSNLSDVNYSSKDLVDEGKVEDLLNDSSYDIEEVYGLVEGIQKQYGINLDYVKKYLDQIYATYNDKIDLDALRSNFNEADLDLSDDVEKLSLQSKKYSVEDYKNIYKSQTSDAKEAINEMATFYQKYEALRGKMYADDPMDFLISPDSPTLTEISEVQKVLDAFKVKKQEILNMPIVQTEDDATKLQELQAEAINLQNILSSVELSALNPLGYDEVFKLSKEDAELLNTIVNGPEVYDLSKVLSTEYNAKVDKMGDAISGEFGIMIAEDASDSLNEFLLKLGEELKLEQQITAEKEQQKVLDEEQNKTKPKSTKKKAAKSVGNEQDVKTDVDSSKIAGGDYALESTLQKTNSILGNILTATQTEGNKGYVGTQQAQEPKQTRDATPEDPFKKKLYNQTSSFNKYKKDLENVEYVSESLRDELDKLGTELHQVTTQGDLTGWVKKFDALKDNVKAAKSVFEQENFGKINLYQKELTSSFNKLTLPQREELLDEYSEAIILLNKQKQAVKEGYEVELEGIKQITAALQEKINKQIESNQAEKDAAKAQKKNSKFGDTAMINATAKHNQLSQIAKSDQFINSAEIAKALEAYDNAYTTMQNMRVKLNNSDDITVSDKEAFKQATTECNEYAKALDKLIKNSLKLHNEKANPDDYMLGSDFVDDANGRKEALANFAKEMYGVSLSAEDFKKNFNEAVFAVDNGDGTFTKMTAKFTDARNEIVAIAGDTKKAQGAFSAFFDELKGKFKSIGAYLIASFSFHEVWSVIRQGVNYVREIDSALTELRKVTNETDASYRQFLQDMSKTASVTGSTVKDLTSSAADWARLGYSMKQAGELAATTSKLLNVSEFSSVDEATSALVSSLQAFTTEGQDVGQRAEEIVDILNHIGNRYPVATNELADGLATSGAALVAANNSIEEQVALLSAGNATMQDISTVASGLKIVAARLRGTTTDIDDDADSAITNVSKLQSKIKALTAEANGGEGIDIINEQGEYKSTYEILTEISKIFDKMDDVSSASLLELIAGKNRSSVVAAILQNGDILEDAYADAFDSAGSSQRELDTYLDSIQGKIDLFNNSIQTMWMNFIEADAVKFIVDLGTGLIKLVDNVGLLQIALTGLLTYLNVSSKSKLDFASMFGIHDVKNGWFANIKTQAKEATGTTKSLLSALQQIQNIPLEIGADVEMAKQVDLLNQKWNEGQESFVNYISSLGDADIALKAYAASVKDGNYSLAGFQQFIQQHNAGIKASGVAAKAAAVGHQLLNAAISMGVSLLISGAISLIMEWANANEKAAKAATEAAEASKELRKQVDSIEDYKEQISELRKELDNGNLSEQDAYDAREKLLTIQNDLIDKFGLEKDGIDLVTGAINDQIAAIDKLSQKKAQQWINNNQKSINEAIKYFDNEAGGNLLDPWYDRTTDADGIEASGIINWGSTQNIIDMIDEYTGKRDHITSHMVGVGAHGISFTGSVEEVKAEVEDFQSWLDVKENELLKKKTELLSLPDKTSQVKAQIMSIEKDIEQLQDVREDMGAEYQNWFGEGSTYAANKAVIEQTQYNTALTQYADQYTKILQAQNDLEEAQLRGDKEGISAALATLNAETDAAAKTAETNGQSYMISFFNGIKDGYAKLSNELKLETDLADTAKDVKNRLTEALSGLDGMNAQEILQLGEIDPNNTYFVTLTQLATEYGMSIEDLMNSIIKFGYIQSGFAEEAENVVRVYKTYSALTEHVTQYNEMLSQTSEIVADNTQVTQEYKDSILALGISEEELNECFDKNNKLVVKDARALNNLVKSAKKNTAQNIKLAKSQARLEYYELYKEMKELTNGTEVVDGATLDYINSLYRQMTALQRTIAKYSLLEAELLGAANAYQELADAQAADEAMDYGGKAEELVNVLAEAFNTAQLGTEAARVAIEGLIPDDVIDKSKTLDEQMQQVYDYFTKGEVSQLFTIEFDDEGAIQSIEMTKENVEAFTESLIGTDSDSVFQGSWDEFTLNPAIKTLEDFAEACGITEEVAFAFLTELEKYDIGNALGAGGDTLLDQLMGDDLDYQLQKAIQTAAEVEKKLAEGTLKATSNEYIEAKKQLEELEEKTIEDVTAWSKKQQVLEEQKDLLKEYQKEYDKAIKNQDTSKVEEFEGKIKDTSKEIDTLIDDLRELDEPTEFVLEVAMSEAKENIAEFKEDINELVESGDEKAIKINSFVEKIDTTGLEGLESLGFVKGPDGIWRGTANIEGWSQLDPASKQKVLEYINMLESEHQIDVLMGEGAVSVEEQLDTIAKILEDIAKILDPTYTLSVETSEAEQKATTFKSIWDGIQSKAVTLTKNVVETVTSFFTRTPKEGDGTSVNGTAHLSGTANAGGSWGAPKTETSLVGELGPELLVRGNRWTTVGENGAEFTQVKRGDIIFNHKQTEELLKNGYVTGRGKAYAGGTAYAMRDKFMVSTKDGGSGINTWDKAYKTVYNDYRNATINTSNSGNNLNNDYNNKGDNSQDEFEEDFDWFEVALEELTNKIELASEQLANLATASEKNAKIDEVIGYNKALIGDENNVGLLDEGIKLYENEASKIYAGLGAYQDLAKNGAIGIELFQGKADEQVLEQIQKYRDYVQKAEDLRIQKEQANSSISDLSKQKFDNVATEYENRISLIEAENSSLETNLDLQEGQVETSQAAYDEMIANSNEMLGILEQEAIDLQTVLDNEVALGNIKVGSDAWYEMQNAIEETKNAAYECSVSLEDLELDKFNLVANDYENQIDLLEAANDQLEARADLLEDQGYEQVNAQYDQMIANTSEMKRKLEEESVALKELLNSGTIPKYSEEWYEMQNTISDVDAAIIDCTASLEEFAQNKLDAITNQFENIIGEVETLNDSLQAQIDLQEEQGKITSPIYYEEMIKNTEQIKKDLEEQRTAMQDTLDAEVAKGNIEVGDDSWYEWIEAISKIDAEIAGCTLDIEKFNNAINDIHWDNFDELIKRYGYVKDEAQNLIDIMSDDDMFITPENEDGWGSLDVKWTDEGLATIGLYAQQMEIAERTSQEYAEAIEELKRQYDEGRYSESEYLERLNELKNGQYENIEAYQDAKDAIVDLNKERIDAVKDGIQKQIDAYEELISKQKEELDSEKDLYDFQKNVSDQQKNIADIERKLSALSLDNSASARAQKAKLEAELYEAKATLEETYYDRSISNQQDALDKELEDFTEEKNAEIEKWDKYLEDVETIIAESLTNVQLNADATYVALKEKAGDYDVALSTAIQKPWEDAATKALSFADVYPKLEEKANEYGMTLAQFLATPWEQAKESPIYQELFNELDAIAQQYGFDLRGYISNGWNSGEDAISSYDGVFANSASGTIKQLDDIKNQWKLVTEQINLAAAAELEYIKQQKEAQKAAKNNTESSENKNNNTNNNKTNNNTQNTNNKPGNTNTQPPKTSTPVRSEKDYYGVALAIWNGNYGWGTGATRSKNLKAKGFDANKVQQIINQMGIDGAVHTNAWKKKYGITSLDPYHLNKFAKGTTGVDKDQWAIIDELGDELVLHAQNGKLAFLTKGSAVIPSNLSENLMELGSMDPQDMLDRNRPAISAPHIVNNEININMSIAEVVHVDHVDHDTLPDLTKAVRKEMDSYMTKLNSAIRSKVR